MHPTVLLAQREGKHSQGHQCSPHGTNTATHFHASPSFLLVPFLLFTCPQQQSQTFPGAGLSSTIESPLNPGQLSLQELPN